MPKIKWDRAITYRVVSGGFPKEVTFQMTHEEGKLGNQETSQGRAIRAERTATSRGAGAGRGRRGGRLWPWSGRQAEASHTAGCLGMVCGELSKCHPNGGIPQQDKPSLRPPTLDALPQTQRLAPAWKSGQLSQSLASRPPQLGNQVLRRHTREGTAVTACRSALPARHGRQANAASKHWHCRRPALSLWPPRFCL